MSLRAEEGVLGPELPPSIRLCILAERPGGRLDREAEGRLLESLAFMDRNTAREAARVYLQHYPSSPHAAFARNLLGL